FAPAEPPCPVADGDFRDARAGGRGRHGRYESVHVRIQVQTVEELPTVGLEGAAVVTDGDARHQPDQAVCYPRRHLPGPEIVLPAQPVPGDEVVALIEHGDQPGDVGWFVLQIPVHAD